jgi:hypothetical protein
MVAHLGLRVWQDSELKCVIHVVTPFASRCISGRHSQRPAACR